MQKEKAVVEIVLKGYKQYELENKRTNHMDSFCSGYALDFLQGRMFFVCGVNTGEKDLLYNLFFLFKGC